MQLTAWRVNIGCGPTPTPGWLNFDNSLSVRLAKYPLLGPILESLGLLDEGQERLISAARNSAIRWADATKRIPLPDQSVEVLYASHMVEHLDRTAVRRFLQEACRVLAQNGVIRIVIPDLRKLVDQYTAEGNADVFMERTLLTRPRSRD